MEKYKFNTVDEAVDDIIAGKMVILVDDEDRENEGDLCMAAEKVTAEAINFMANTGRTTAFLSNPSGLTSSIFR
jgi:3,4-dihydroxy 2-butanone 4-phosphate synthase/GTP cyclohydrolase II